MHEHENNRLINTRPLVKTARNEKSRSWQFVFRIASDGISLSPP